MSTPNPIDPEDRGEELGARNAAEQAREQQILDALSADMAGSAAAQLATQLVPVVPDGGTVGRTVAPHVSRITKTRDSLRIWGPAVAATGAGATAVAVLPLPGPLALYVLALAAFAWWHCAGRPGPIDTTRMLTGSTAENYGRLRERVTRLAERRGAYEARRTASGEVGE
ncbi:hypothetical protein KO481_33505 [Nocardia sp. NEAU-G5]|uniref:DUF3040 domain-containing protein n=1 Tax=Nocardia albiluteola TaxID=2842303 RepID=A0ABS6B7Y0_9NOCA|nr:hypothetical protein [Nocardia albiluteola]MBU3066426.1 hypothetical protein [Nocardia albiluteola]